MIKTTRTRPAGLIRAPISYEVGHASNRVTLPLCGHTKTMSYDLGKPVVFPALLTHSWMQSLLRW